MDEVTHGMIHVGSITFALYKYDLAELRAHLAGADSASFDVTQDGFVTVYVAGKEPLKL